MLYNWTPRKNLSYYSFATFAHLFRCPKDVFIKPLQHNHIKTVVEHWELTYPEAEQKLTNWLKLRQGFGVFLKEDNQLVSWITPSCFGKLLHISVLITYLFESF